MKIDLKMDGKNFAIMLVGKHIGFVHKKDVWSLNTISQIDNEVKDRVNEILLELNSATGSFSVEQNGETIGIVSSQHYGKWCFVSDGDMSPISRSKEAPLPIRATLETLNQP